VISEADRQAVTEFLYREARLADEALYAEWLALWTDDGVYWVPATTDPAVDPDKHLSHIYDNRARLDTRIAMLRTGQRHSQEPASRMRRLISNIEIETTPDGDFIAMSNFLLGELSIQANPTLNLWIGRTTHHLRKVDGSSECATKKSSSSTPPNPSPTSRSWSDHPARSPGPKPVPA
jgi:3-phenylpropionate/cinnamic acid dioxygenase small subunit